MSPRSSRSLDDSAPGRPAARPRTGGQRDGEVKIRTRRAGRVLSVSNSAVVRGRPPARCTPARIGLGVEPGRAHTDRRAGTRHRRGVLGLVVERVGETSSSVPRATGMVGQPAGGVRERGAGRDQVGSRGSPDARQVEDPMVGNGWARSGRAGTARSKGSDTISKSCPAHPPRARPPGGRQHHLVADVEHQAGRRGGLVTASSTRAPGSRCAVMVQRQAVIGHRCAGDRRGPSHDAPLPRRELMRPVHVRVPEVRGVGWWRNTISRCERFGSPSRPRRLRDRRGVLAIGTGSPAGRAATGSSSPDTPAPRHDTKRPTDRGSARRSVAAART